VQTLWDTVINTVLPFLPQLISAILIVAIGLPVARTLQKKCLKKIHLDGDPTIKRFLINLLYILTVVFIGISALTTMGIATTSLLTLLGAASLAIGFALKDFLSNIAAGFVLIFLRPFKVGDYIKVQSAIGTVAEINLFMTVLSTIGNEVLFIPNNQVITNYVTNYTHNTLRRLDINVDISYKANIKQARGILLQEMAAHEHTQSDPAPIVVVDNLGDNAIQLIARLWVDKDYYTQIKYDLLERFKISLDAAHINIPYPQLTVHLSQNEEKNGK
jgi:small conductance mechanosensitive channel